ncbi:MAG: hypothetical protein K6F92_03260 [Lachnospiraceae bacterium]|nr:hypothetical protein [Lachnospiraceae bacterium]
MKKYIFGWIFLFVVFFVIGAELLCAFAGQVILYYNKETQQRTEWCWVASAKNAVKYTFDTTRTQSQAVDHIKGSIINEGGTLDEIRTAANWLSEGRMNYEQIGLGTVSGVKTYGYLTDKIDNGRVTVLVGGYYTDGVRNGGHAVTMHGYYSYGSYASMIWYYDPLPEDNLDHECAYSSFKNGSYNGRLYDGTVYCTQVY